MAWVLTVALGAAFAAWLSFALALRRMGALPALGHLPATLPDDGAAWPAVSVVVACRNEEAAVRQAISSLLAQDYPQLEVVVVDDRSEDATGAILRELAAGDPRLRVTRVDTLPPGWLGKTHAMHQGAAAATGAWILFTDADVMFAPDTLRRTVAWALREGLGHAVALPRFVAPGFLERGFVSLFGLLLLLHLRVDDLRRPGTPAYIGVGAFNLVRAAAYRAIGGHQLLRLEVADDIKLGMLLRRSGVPQGCADSNGLVRVRWQRGFRASMRGLLKNFFAGSEYRWTSTLQLALLMLVGTTLPLAGLVLALRLCGPWTWALGAGAVVLPMAMLGASARRLAGGRGPEGLLLPIAGACLAGVALASALLATVRGAIIWRGTRYPLAELRAGTVRAADWPFDRAPGWSSPQLGEAGAIRNQRVRRALTVWRRSAAPKTADGASPKDGPCRR